MYRKNVELYVGNLDENMTEPMLYNAFSIYGPISSVKIMRHIVTHKSRGFGFVNFMNPKHAEKAKNDLNNKVILKNKIKVYMKSKFKSLNR